MKYSIGIVNWDVGDGLSAPIFDTFQEMDHLPIHFLYDEPVPEHVDIVFSFAPYKKFYQFARQIGQLDGKRPIFVHWDTEMQVNPKVPGKTMLGFARLRSWYSRLLHRKLKGNKFINKLDSKYFRLLCLGDYDYSQKKGWLDILFEFSHFFSEYLNKIKIPTVYVPWGTHPSWYGDLGFERDIDILWMGTWRSERRKQIFNNLRAELEPQGIKFFIADNVIHPFIYGAERTGYLNRSKITLNLLPAWYISNFDHRFGVAAGNRSLVISEPFLPHNPTILPGTHFISAPIDQLAETILYYLKNDDERNSITEKAYKLATTELTLANSLGSILNHIENFRG